MKVTIGVPTERRTYRGPNDTPIIVTIPFTTEKGYEGEVVLEEIDAASEEKVKEAIKKKVTALEGMIGKGITL